jgi:hypothetical protein
MFLTAVAPFFLQHYYYPRSRVQQGREHEGVLPSTQPPDCILNAEPSCITNPDKGSRGLLLAATGGRPSCQVQWAACLIPIVAVHLRQVLCSLWRLFFDWQLATKTSRWHWYLRIKNDLRGHSPQRYPQAIFHPSGLKGLSYSFT